MEDKNLSSSLVRGLAILSSFTAEHPLIGITELATKLQLNKSTVHRYVDTLRTLGYLEQDVATKKFRLGIRVVEFGVALLGGMELRQIALPCLEDLATQLGLTVNMSVLDGIEIVYIERVRMTTIINLELHVGSRLPAYCTSMGKVLLAFLPPADLAKRIKQMDLARRGPNTITGAEELIKELARVRERGFAVNNEELAHGLRSVAAPVRSRKGEVVAAINIAVHTALTSTSDMQTVLAPKLVATATEISHRLGLKDAFTAE